MYHLLREEKKNIGGLISFFFIEANQIVRDPMPYQLSGQSLLVEELPLQSNAKWYQGIVIKFTLSYDERKRASRAGEYFEQSISGVIARQSPELSEILRSLDRRRFVAVTLDHNGYLKMVGSKECPLTFGYSGTSAKSPRERNQVSFSFEGKTRKPSLYIDGQLYNYLADQLQPNYGDVSIRQRVLDDGITIRKIV